MNKQLQFNLKEPSLPSAYKLKTEEPSQSDIPRLCNLKTKEISWLTSIIDPRQEIPVDEVRKRLKANNDFTVIGAHIKMRVVPSKERKQGKFWVADVEFLPAIVPQ